MADIDIYQEDSEDPQDDGGDDAGLGCDDYETGNPDDNLTPFQKLEKYIDSENIFSRQVVARSLLETMPAVGDDPEEATKVLKAMVKLSDDPEPTVRAELMEQVPHLAVYCHENPHLFTAPIPNYLLPTVVRYLTDSHNQVRKTSQAALLVLLEQELVDKGDVEEQVCPVILELSSPFSVDDFRTEAVALMSKMAPLVGKDITERVFMMRFAELCTDALFHVRKVCAANFGDMCTVVGQENTEKYLLPKFYCLCEDGVWGVRKACAECFMAVACACSIEVRRQDLATLFITLICDQSRWVRMAAFQALGGFISTFADPDVTGIYLNEEGVLVAGNPDKKHEPIKFIDDDDDDEEKKDESSSDNEAVTDEDPSSSTGTTPCSDAIQGTSPPSVSTSDNKADTNNTVPSACDSSAQQPAKSEQDSPSTSDDNDAAANIPVSPTDADIQVVGMELEIEEELSDSQIETPKSFTTDGANASSDTLQSGDSLNTTPANPSSSNMSLEEVRAESNQYTMDTSSQCHSDSKNLTQNEPCPASSESPMSCSGNDNSAVDSEAVSNTEPQLEGRTDSSSAITSGASPVSSSPPSVICDLPVDQAAATVVDKKAGGDKEISPAVPTSKRSPVHGVALEVEEEDYNDFTFWRMPLPEVDLDLDGVKESVYKESITGVSPPSSSSIVQGDQDSGIEVDAIGTLLDGIHLVNLNENQANQDSTEQIACLNTVSESTEETEEETVTNIGSTHVLGQHLKESTLTVVNGVVQDVNAPGIGYSPRDGSNFDASSDYLTSELQQFQDVIPQALLDHYLSMTDPSRAQNTDTEIVRHCAYSLPAVAYTLGRKHWPCLKELYKTLAADMQWKVRRTLAFSIHELAVIVGEDITNNDLVPVFNDFLRDLDEVRIGVLKHFSDFLRLLRPEIRKSYLTKIPDFLNTDNTRNWRFRDELASQLLLLLDQYDEESICEHVLPIGITLCEDKVSEVRHTAFKVMSGILKRFSTADNSDVLVKGFVNCVINRFAMSQQWNKRQIYAHLCHHVLEDDALEAEKFAQSLLPSLVNLGRDAIPNVRIALAKTLSLHIIPSEYYLSDKNPHYNELSSIIDKLKEDNDSDVKHFINQPPQTEVNSANINEEPGPWGLSAFERTVHFNFGWS